MNLICEQMFRTLHMRSVLGQYTTQDTEFFLECYHRIGYCPYNLQTMRQTFMYIKIEFNSCGCQKGVIKNVQEKKTTTI